MTPTLSSPPELLAPAGSLEAFIAAMDYGADAVYAGLRDFSARAKARNFTPADLEQMTRYAHGLGRKVYVTLNTLVKEAELPQLIETLAALEAMQVDAVILQDLAVMRLARRHFPGLELHASTQMTVHNAAGVKMLERMGFTRGVLARELTLEEIAAIKRQTTLELEHFIHGALCFCFSGQCYFSSWLGGKSGNRGRCAQPCRRRYRYRQQDGYYFSTNDLSAIDLIPQMVEAGVVSLKIEGRMKSAEYVANVVGAYRQVLDAPAEERPAAVREAKQLLKASFGRPPTRGFLGGPKPTDIAVPSVKGSTGRLLGEVKTVRGKAIAFKSRDSLHLGDRLRIQPKSDQAGTAFTVKELKVGQGPAKKAPAGAFVTVSTPFTDKFKVGDGVFKVSSEQAFTMSEAACRRKFSKAPAPLQQVALEIALAGNTLSVAGRCGEIRLEQRYPVETFPAEATPLSQETLTRVFEKSGGEPFCLAGLEAADLPPVVIPPSRLKEIRRDFYGHLGKALQGARKQRRTQQRATALADLAPARPARPAHQREVQVVLRDLRDLPGLNDPAIDRVIVPLTGGNLHMLQRQGRRLSGRENRVVWDIPMLLIGEAWKDQQQAVRALHQRGFTRFRLNNLGHFPLFDGLEGVQLQTSYRLFSLNSEAIDAWRELGIAEAELYIEDDRENISALLQRDLGVPLALPVYGSVPLITSRIPIRSVRNDRPVVSDRGDAYRVEQRHGLTVISSEIDFSLIGLLAELQNSGCGHFTVDLAHIGPSSPRGKQVLESLKRGQEVPGTSRFNFEMGME